MTRKIGRNDLVFGVRSGFVSMCIHPRLQVSVCSGIRFVSPWLTLSTHGQAAF